MNIILFDDESRGNLLPLTYTRPCADIRIGILTIAEKWERYMGSKPSYITQSYLSKKYPLAVSDDNFVVNGTLLPNDLLCRLIKQLDTNEALLHHDVLLAARLDEDQFNKLNTGAELDELEGFQIGDTPFEKVNHLWDIFGLNDIAIQADFDLITAGRSSQPLSGSNTIIGNGKVFLEEGAKVECAILNTNNGPIYVGKNAEIMEGSIVRGGLAMCENSVLKMGAKVYGPTTLGPYCKVGGEVNNVVFFGYSNKGHDGFLGNSVVGEWCNFGADTNNSNLKNNYAEVRLWNSTKKTFEKTGLQFCGLVMGDHSKCGINTMFNTGTVVGVSCNIFGEGFPRNFVPSFSWGGHKGFQEYKVEKAFETAEKVMARRKVALSDVDKAILEKVFELSR